MNHVYAVALRWGVPCLPPSPCSSPVRSLLPSPRPCRLWQSRLASTRQFTIIHRIVEKTPVNIFASRDSPSRRLSSSATTRFQSALSHHRLGPLRPPTDIERGLAFGEAPLTPAELNPIFGAELPPPDQANRLLRVLHGRRVDGTLDLALPEDLQYLVRDHPHAVEAGLSWLRDNYAVDEDEAIIARIEREESGYEERTPSQLRQRAQDLKLYGPQTGKIDQERRDKKEPEPPQYHGPQSGRYQAKLSEKGDVFGESQIERIREQNEAKSKQEEAELDQQIEEIQARRVAQAKVEQSQALAARPEQAVETAQEEIRPPNSFERWVLQAKNRSSSKLTLDSPQIRDRSSTSRLLPSFAFALLFGSGCWFLAQTWSPPKRSDRLWPDMSLSFATVAGIITVNAAIFVLWRFPPAWRILNKYCLVVPAIPNPISMVGNIFSHAQWKHFLFNMLPLVVFGPSLHEDLGRGNFMALYLMSGVVGSVASLTNHTLRGILHTSSLGASGSIWAVTAAFFSIHSSNDFTIFFMPEEWKEQVSVKGWMLFLCLIAIDIGGGIRGKPVTVDYVAHVAGALSGWIMASWFKWNQAQLHERGEFVSKTKLPWWQVILQEGEQQDKGAS